MISVFFVSSVFERAHEVLPSSPPTGAFAKVLMAFHSSLTGGQSVAIQSLNYLEQKRRGSMYLRAYPIYQALALPSVKDKQRKACPRRVIYIHTTAWASLWIRIYRHTGTPHADIRLYIRQESTPICLEYTLLYI